MKKREVVLALIWLSFFSGSLSCPGDHPPSSGPTGNDSPAPSVVHDEYDGLGLSDSVQAFVDATGFLPPWVIEVDEENDDHASGG